MPACASVEYREMEPCVLLHLLVDESKVLKREITRRRTINNACRLKMAASANVSRDGY